MRHRETFAWDRIIAILINMILWAVAVEAVWQLGLKAGWWHP